MLCGATDVVWVGVSMVGPWMLCGNDGFSKSRANSDDHNPENPEKKKEQSTPTIPNRLECGRNVGPETYANLAALIPSIDPNEAAKTSHV